MKDELVAFARTNGLGVGGLKPAARKTVSTRLPEPLTAETVIGPSQASSQKLRAFLAEAIGPPFYFDIHMRTYLGSEVTKTLGEVVTHWHATRTAPKPETPPQLEYVRFTKRWYRNHPMGTALECRAAGKVHRSLPVDLR